LINNVIVPKDCLCAKVAEVMVEIVMQVVLCKSRRPLRELLRGRKDCDKDRERVAERNSGQANITAE
jgi:hypothetical protein